MWEWIISVAHRIASVTGFKEPAAKGAIVRGIRPTEIRRSKVQWYDPWLASAGGTTAASFTREGQYRLECRGMTREDVPVPTIVSATLVSRFLGQMVL